MSAFETLHYRDRTGVPAATRFMRTGRGPAVLLVHGVGMQATVWQPQIEVLSQGYDVIALDMLGHGGSSLPPADAGLSDYADQILALLDGLGLDAVHVVGHSMGALVALEFALSHPARVLSVVAANAVFCRSPEQRQAIESRLAALDDGFDGASWDGTVRRWFGEPVPAHWQAAAAGVRHLLDAVEPVGYGRTYRLFATADEAHRDRLAGLGVPALFITADGDPNSSPQMSEAMARLAPQGEVQIVRGQRHMMSVAAPGEINRRLLAFLDRVGTAAKDRGGPAAAAGSPSQDAFDRLAFRKALGSFLTGVTVVATMAEDGAPRGFTANSFTSVSLDPPLILICIARTASSYPVFAGSGHFSVNILADTQADLSSLFATRSADKFAGAAWRRGPAGSPILDGVAAWFDCRRHEAIEAGDHVILIGEVVGFDHRPLNPLGYCRGAHVTFGLSLDKVAASGGKVRVGAILEHDDAILFIAGDDGRLDLPAGIALGTGTDPASLAGRMRHLGIEADLGFLFAVFEDPQAGAGAMSIYYRGTLKAPPDQSGALRLIRFGDIPWDRLRDYAIRSMLGRYVRERNEDVFGIYVGDAVQGTVHPLQRQV
ncbi:alpha/beta fold hydrolase [Labrys monachus]|uniref:Flavin reductase (DIM6/NTAB) family NADH-FMN oxidoreductase RutF/pimeloyl-ACP methyl ester carboxylesterase n=1 Tax=Labrys monachus TaxID=217067 RepID=A0ABU0F6M9_9HYPH|nr:alpha/beta fold hydrolase [Labrys monachus]MDQ0390277.1 flavin reductase (DIM6/NTAB) family NADH-FMN oxidoreductase RutF/pimeloyl-ACP methyl ester carboxylesterase [Labrys monachus]